MLAISNITMENVLFIFVISKRQKNEIFRNLVKVVKKEGESVIQKDKINCSDCCVVFNEYLLVFPVLLI